MESRPSALRPIPVIQTPDVGARKPPVGYAIRPLAADGAGRAWSGWEADDNRIRHRPDVHLMSELKL